MEPSKHKKNRILVFLEGGQLLKIPENARLHYDRRPGADLPEETVEELNTFSKALLPTLSAAVGLTTLHQDPFAMGVAAGHMVLDAIAGKSIEPAFVRPDTPLILRETTAPPAATAASAQA